MHYAYSSDITLKRGPVGAEVQFARDLDVDEVPRNPRIFPQQTAGIQNVLYKAKSRSKERSANGSTLPSYGITISAAAEGSLRAFGSARSTPVCDWPDAQCLHGRKTNTRFQASSRQLIDQ